ncbi:MAG TPA: hypothetical protein VMC02_03790 [Steroidobacteraceae bacterium]|nr:hypothetical protein [Steroidobacteraceae bacterium]
MRNSALLLALGLAGCALATASTAPVPKAPAQGSAPPPDWPRKSISLNRADALADLQRTNPRHYRIAQQILAAAQEICKAGKPALLSMKFEAQDIACVQAFWLTSNPPKHALHFRIDDTTYSALVTVRDLVPKSEPIR